MTGCCVLMCPGSTRKGLRCFRFPRDPERRKKWEAQLKRDRWKATDHSYICELHFEPSQFEQRRADGWKKLKQNAIPTLFANNTQPPKQQTEQGSRSKRRKKRPEVTRGEAAINKHSEADHKPEALMSFCEVVLTYESYSSGTGSTTVTIHQIAEQGEPLTPH
ncbi:THAP domain-containing protein 1-like isoform X1 [Dermacentor variabilis]|uniref:THAP domain-containing protein 1-like isoform X1 n=1 Tax=Dermacentor variabilis TaxID=34621 RepID=UPI003F5B0CC4